MFIFEKAPFKSCHASTLVEHEPGKLIAAWFAGDAEGAKNVQICGSTFDGKKWSEREVMGPEPGQRCGTRALSRPAGGPLSLGYKAGPSPGGGPGYARKPPDSGKTGSNPEMMPAGMWGPVRAKPIQLGSG